MRRLWLSLLLCISLPSAHAQSDTLETIRELRLQGELDVAIQMANEQLVKADDAEARALHLELAKLHDRVGLHTGTRPVAASLRHIEAAAALVGPLDELAEAEVNLAYAEYYYRAEMADREFDEAKRYAGLALEAFQELEDSHGQADAVHLFGLISLQQRDLDKALGLFEESLVLDRAAGLRPLLLADYERHVGFVYALRGEHDVALPFFERSLEVREQAGAIDPAMFAAISLASTLIELDRDEGAVPHLEYAADIADSIDSATGRARVDALVERLRLDLQDDFGPDESR